MATLTRIPAGSVPPGSVLKIYGNGFPGQDFAILVWNNSVQSPKIRTAKDGSFDTSFTVPNVADGTYTLQGRMISSGQTIASVSVAVLKVATPSATVPGAPINLAGVAGNTLVTLSWNAPSSDGGSGITGYRIYRNGVLRVSIANITSYQDTGLLNGNSYTYQVSAINVMGEGPKSNSVSVTPVYVAPPPPPTGLPPIPAGYGTVFKKDFSDGTLTPFVPQTHNNDHPGTLMVQYETFVTDSNHISVHDGYLDLKCTSNLNGIWSSSMVGTYIVNANPPTRTFDFQYGTVRWMARMNYGKGAWHGLWYWSLWNAPDAGGSEPEIDWPELIQSRTTGNIHGTAFDGQIVNLAPPDDGWHEYKMVKTSTYIACFIDGVEKTRWNHTMTARQVLIADCKVGLEAPDGTTPSPLFVNVAWVTVDP
jgi:hypothetical protein